MWDIRNYIWSHDVEKSDDHLFSCLNKQMCAMIVPNKSAIKFDCMSKNSTSSTFATASHDCVFYLYIIATWTYNITRLGLVTYIIVVLGVRCMATSANCPKFNFSMQFPRVPYTPLKSFLFCI